MGEKKLKTCEKCRIKRKNKNRKNGKVFLKNEEIQNNTKYFLKIRKLKL